MIKITILQMEFLDFDFDIFSSSFYTIAIVTENRQLTSEDEWNLSSVLGAICFECSEITNVMIRAFKMNHANTHMVITMMIPHQIPLEFSSLCCEALSNRTELSLREWDTAFVLINIQCCIPLSSQCYTRCELVV